MRRTQGKEACKETRGKGEARSFAGKKEKCQVEVWDEGEIRSRVEEITAMMAGMFPNESKTAHDVRGVIREAFTTVDGLYGEQEAAQWGEGFEWPPGVYERDAQLAIEADYDLEGMVARQHQGMTTERLSAERVCKWVPVTDPDYARMLLLADGMRVVRGEDFMPNGKPPPMRNLYKKVHKAVNKVQAKLWMDGLVFLLPREVADKCGPLHYSPAHWAPKVGKKSGRCIFDSSDGKFSAPLNSDEARLELERLYGAIEHPTLEDLVRMVLEYAAEMKQKLGAAFKWEDLVIWKGDLRGAFLCCSSNLRGCAT